MNENINLCEILEGLEGIELYSSVYGTVIFIGFVGTQLKMLFHRKNAGDGNVFYESNGHLHFTISDDECTLFPSKEQRDWSKFERPIPIDTPIMCKNITNSYWKVGYYAESIKDSRGTKHYIFASGTTSKENRDVVTFDIMIPFDKFNPNNIEESLKYNIQK